MGAWDFLALYAGKPHAHKSLRFRGGRGGGGDLVVFCWGAEVPILVFTSAGIFLTFPSPEEFQTCPTPSTVGTVSFFGVA